MTEQMSIWMFFYILGALVVFFGIWKKVEKVRVDDDDFHDRPRWQRIGIRILVFLLWPVVFLLAVAGIAWGIIKYFVKAFVE